MFIIIIEFDWARNVFWPYYVFVFGDFVKFLCQNFFLRGGGRLCCGLNEAICLFVAIRIFNFFFLCRLSFLYSRVVKYWNHLSFFRALTYLSLLIWRRFLLFLQVFRIKIRIKRNTIDNSFQALQEFHMLYGSWSLFIVKPISLLNQIESLTYFRFVKLKQLKQIAIVEVFLESFFTRGALFLFGTFINFNGL